jgi:hypothetical protein
MLPMADNPLLADISDGVIVEMVVLLDTSMRDPKRWTVLLPMEPVLMIRFAFEMQYLLKWAFRDVRGRAWLLCD